RATHADEQPRAAGAGNAQGTPGVEVVGRKCQRIQHREPLAVVELPAEGWRALAHGDLAVIAAAADLDVDDSRFGLLAQLLGGVLPAGEHVVRGDRRMTDETGFGTRREEAGPQIVA